MLRACLRRCALVLTGSVGLFAPPVADARDVDFVRDIQPLLARHCFDCHGPDAQEGQLRLDAKAIVFQGGLSGPAVVPGKGAESLLVRRLVGGGDEARMPLDADPLSAEEIGLIRAWIDQGAKWPDGVGAQVAALQKHWAYVKPRRPAIPQVQDRGWVRNPIDAFILARLEAEGLSPSPEADKERLLRRVTLDLTGVPPTLAEIDAFLADNSPDAYGRVVDRLLASPRYGERWAAPWLDAARYADSNGYQRDGRRENWAYRDWVIRALNADMPFDRFTIEQIAGDLLPDRTLAQQIATGFHRNTMANVEAGTDPEEEHTLAVIDRVNTTATVWLGTTLACAQCHNHKYDPFSQREYYRLYAFFNHTAAEIEAFPNGSRREFTGPSLTLPIPPQRQERRQQVERQLAELNERVRQATDQLKSEQPAWEETVAMTMNEPPARTKVPAAIRAVLARPADRRNEKQRQQLEKYYLSLSPELRDLQKRLDQTQAESDRLAPPTTLVMQELPEMRTTRLFQRGDFLQPGETVQPGTPAVLHPLRRGSKVEDRRSKSPVLRPATFDHRSSSGPGVRQASDPAAFGDRPPDRLDLARWLVAEDNPLTARVTVNRHWARFFGRGLVTTLEDFGTQGERPTHPQLLDWLAVEFMGSAECGVRNAESESSIPHSALRTPHSRWSLKHLHRLIVTSAAYRQSARVTPELQRRDADNALYARGPRRRLSAELVRDNALAVGGLLSDAMHGPPVFPYQPAGVWNHIGKASNVWETSTGQDRYRRGLYVYWRRTVPYPSFVNFDAPTRETCTVQRSPSNTPLQALTLMNDPAYVEMAAALATRLMTELPAEATTEDRVTHGFRLATSRHPTEAEIEILTHRFDAERDRYQNDPAAVKKLTARWKPPADSAAADFAAWVHVASVLLNLDETISR